MEALYFYLGIAVFALSLPIIALKLGKEWLIALAAIYLITGNIFAQAFVDLFGLQISLAIAVYGAVFLITDLLTEFYGRDTALKGVWIALSGQVIFLIIMTIMLLGPIAPDYLDAYREALSTVPRLVVASFTAYFVSQHVDVFIYHAIKKMSGNSMTKLAIAVRNNGSTYISQAFDTVIFLTIGFMGTELFPTFASLLGFMFFTWTFKVVVAILDTATIIIAKKYIVNNHYKEFN